MVRRPEYGGGSLRTHPLACKPVRDEFHKAGGSAACLVAKLHRDPEAARETSIAGGSMDVYGPFFRSVLFPLWEQKVRQRPVVERSTNLLANALITDLYEAARVARVIFN